MDSPSNPSIINIWQRISGNLNNTKDFLLNTANSLFRILPIFVNEKPTSLPNLSKTVNIDKSTDTIFTCDLIRCQSEISLPELQFKNQNVEERSLSLSCSSLLDFKRKQEQFLLKTNFHTPKRYEKSICSSSLPEFTRKSIIGHQDKKIIISASFEELKQTKVSKINIIKPDILKLSQESNVSYFGLHKPTSVSNFDYYIFTKILSQFTGNINELNDSVKVSNEEVINKDGLTENLEAIDVYLPNEQSFSSLDFVSPPMTTAYRCKQVKFQVFITGVLIIIVCFVCLY